VSNMLSFRSVATVSGVPGLIIDLVKFTWREF
jgi:hypothetical protein